MNTDEQIYTYRITRQVRAGGSAFVSGCFTLVAVACMIFVPWVVGVPAGLNVIDETPVSEVPSVSN